MDLSYAAAKSLKMVRGGITRVKVEVISTPV
ncbi:MAG: septal ring lytic transglycosylase RlpA family protein [Candidatus Dadabacteria bacterium]|nr:septal ring lytic transglycosylase RlpA family protein [Candidatus Dadabacteria bacterium]